MGTVKHTRPRVRLCTSVLAGAGLGVFALGLAGGIAQASPAPAPNSHWCPGNPWDPSWGNNLDPNHCHDWQGPGGPYQGGPGGLVGWGPWGPPPPWAPPPPPPPPWAPGANLMWNPNANSWGFWNNGVWTSV
jgi:hypothetical protein